MSVSDDPPPQLHAAVLAGDATTVRLLLARGADLEARDAEGRTALMLAQLSHQWEARCALLDAGANRNPALPMRTRGEIRRWLTLYTSGAGHCYFRFTSGQTWEGYAWLDEREDCVWLLDAPSLFAYGAERDHAPPERAVPFDALDLHSLLW